MATYTNNFSLTEPAYGDKADIGVINQGVTEKVDRQLYRNRAVSAPMYDPTEGNVIGDLRINGTDGLLYKCTAPTSGVWDSTKWTLTDLASELENAGSASALSDLTDVDLTNPSEGQILVRDANSKWVNSDMPDASVTKEVTGNPLTFSDGADAPLVECKAEIVATQDLHGYDKPWVGGAGKNLLPATVENIKSKNTGGTWSGNIYTYNGVTMSILTNSGNNVVGITINTSGATAETQLIIADFGYNADTAYYVTSGVTQPVSGLAMGSNGFGSWNINEQRSIDRTGQSGFGSYIYYRINNGATISNVTVYPMIRLSTVTDATFAPYSNICPISGYDEVEIEGCGKNLISGYTAERSVNSSGVIVNDNSACVANKIEVFPNTTYTLSYTKNTTLLAIHCYDASDNYLGYVLGQTTSPYTFAYSTLKPNTKEVIIQWNQSGQGSTLPTNGQLEVGSSATEYEVYKTPNSYTISLGSTRYGGELDVSRGVLTLTKKEVVFDGSSDEDWNTEVSSAGRNFYINLPDALPLQYVGTGLLSNMFEASPLGAMRVDKILISNGKNLNVPVGDSLGITTVADWKTWLSTHNFEVVYNTAPTTSSITPTQVRSLLGSNYLSCNSGDLDVVYITEGYQALVNLIQKEQGHIYSTGEQVVGTWTDGKPIYEKTVVSELALTSSWQQYLSSADMETIVSVDARYTRDNEDVPGAFSNYEVATWINRSGYIQVCGQGNASSGWKIQSLTIQYTKTSNRSLNASLTRSEAQISEGTNEVEEIPTEEENEANNEVTEEPKEEMR